MNDRGFTLTELIIVLAIIGILVGPVSKFLLGTVKGLTDTTAHSMAQQEVLAACSAIEGDLRNAVQIDTAAANGQFIGFRMDASRMPGHICNPPDDDGDANAIVSPANRWKVGFNVYDDDDNNDGLIDAQCQIYQQGDQVILAHSWNEGPWIQKVLLTGVPPNGLRFQFFGSPSEPTGQGLDRNGDGTIDFSELDVDNNGALDAGERTAITGIDVRLAQDVTGRCGPILANESNLGDSKFWMRSRLSPILLPVRAKP